MNYEFTVTGLKRGRTIEFIQDREHLKKCVQYFKNIRDTNNLDDLDNLDDFDNILPPFPPVLYRAVNVEVENYQTINSELMHRALTKKLNKEFIKKKLAYQLKIQQIQLIRKIRLFGNSNKQLDILRYIVMFI